MASNKEIIGGLDYSNENKNIRIDVTIEASLINKIPGVKPGLDLSNTSPIKQIDHDILEQLKKLSPLISMVPIDTETKTIKSKDL